MWLMLQEDEPDDFVIATGESHTVREFCEHAFRCVGAELSWRGSGVDEIGVDASGKTLVQIDPVYFRPAEVDALIGDSSKARKALGWAPRATFDELVRLMVEADLQNEA
jgi:GDPmannose 4,6-dehydratase